MYIVEEYQITALVAMLVANGLLVLIPYIAVREKGMTFDFKYAVYALLGVIVAMPAYLPQISGGTFIEVFFQAAAYSLTGQYAIEKGASVAANLARKEEPAPKPPNP